MKKFFLLIALALLAISTASALEPVRVAIATSAATANIDIAIVDYSGPTTIYSESLGVLNANSSGIISFLVGYENLTWAGISSTTINTNVLLNVTVGGSLYAQYRLDNIVFAQASVGSGAATPFSPVTFGDLKYGFQTTDHNGWVRLDGRLKATLTASQQTIATTLGIGANLPNATDNVLKQKGTTAVLGTGGANSSTIAQTNLPNVNFSGTAASAGAHTHGITDPGHDHETGQEIVASGAGAVVANTNDGNAPTTFPTETATTGITIVSDGAHTHSVTVSSGGSGTVLTVENAYIDANAFIYLGP